MWCTIEKGGLNMAKERFVETYTQGVTKKVVVDTQTRVNYLLMSSIMNLSVIV